MVACRSWTWTFVLDGVEPEIIGPPAHHALPDASPPAIQTVYPWGDDPADLSASLGSLHCGRPAKFAL